MKRGGAVQTIITFLFVGSLAVACGDRQTCGAGTQNIDGVCQIAPGQDSAPTDQGPPTPDMAPPDLSLPDVVPIDLLPTPPDIRPPTFCGNKWLDPGEQCDDGNFDNTDGCLDTCRTARCGDGYLHLGSKEVCDDGNLSNSDGCLATCIKNVCGDGYTNLGVEECDDQNTVNTDACISSCKVARCGDGHLFKGVEECDDGNNKDGDTCPAVCKFFSSATPGKVTGKVTRYGVTDESGVTLTLSPGGYTAKSNTTGLYTITGAKPGIYTLTASYPYFASATIPNVTVLPNSTFQAPNLHLTRYSTLPFLSNTWVLGMNKTDKHALLFLNGELSLQPLPSGKPTVVAMGAYSPKVLFNGTHMTYRDAKGALFILEIGGTTPVKVADDVDLWQEVAPGMWLIVWTKNKTLLFVSPDGKKSYTVTKSYVTSQYLFSAEKLIVLGKDGLFALPTSGGPPITLDSQTGASYCEKSIGKAGCGTPSTMGGLTKDEGQLFYFVYLASTQKAELRTVSTSAVNMVKLAQLDFSTGMTKANVSSFGNDTQLLIQESGYKGGASWIRYSAVPMKGGKLVLLAEGNGVAGGELISGKYFSPAGNAAAFLMRPYSGSTYSLKLVSTDGKVNKSLGSLTYGRQVKFSSDGKRLYWSPRAAISATSPPALKSIASDGTDPRTHLSDTRSLFSFSAPGSTEPDWSPLSNHVVLAFKSPAGSWTTKALPYLATSTSSALTLASSCPFKTALGLDNRVFDNYLVWGGTSQAGDLSLFISQTGKTVFIDKGWPYIQKPIGLGLGDTAVFPLLQITSQMNWTAVNLRTGKVGPVATTSMGQLQPTTTWGANGGYTLLFEGGPSSSTTGKIACFDMKTLAATTAGIYSSAIAIEGENKAPYRVFLDPTLAGGTLRTMALKTCKVANLGSGGLTSLKTYKVLTSPDKKTVAIGTSEGILAAPLAGGKGLTVANKSTQVTALASEVLYYRRNATSPSSQDILMAAPLTGGSSTEINKYSFSTFQFTPGKRDLIYGDYSFKYVDMP